MTKNDFDPIKNGVTLWTVMAVVAALYGTEVINFKQQDINELESIQGNFLARLLGQRMSVSHTAVRKEVRVEHIMQIMMNMKLNYWYHLTKSTDRTTSLTGVEVKFAKELLDIQKEVGTPQYLNQRRLSNSSHEENHVPFQQVKCRNHCSADNPLLEGIS